MNWANGNSTMLSNAQKEEIRLFADRITPQSWNMMLDPKDERIEPTVLNIHLKIKGPQDEIYTDFFGRKCYPYEDRDGTIWYANSYGDTFQRNQVRPILGMISGRMVFSDLKTFGIGRKGKVASIIVCLWPYLGDWKGTLIHELAHVAVYRYHACRIKDYTHKALFKNPWNIDIKAILFKERVLREGHHGPSFQKAFLSITKRAIMEFAAELPRDDDLWKNLQYALLSLRRK